MATPKTLTLTDVKQKRLYLERQNGNILVQRDFVFLTTGNVEVAALGTHVYETTIAIASLPANVQSALQAIDNYLYSQILAQEGMS